MQDDLINSAAGALVLAARSAAIEIRPEHFIPWQPEMGDSWVRFPYHVHRTEYLGAERLLYGEVGQAKAVARFPANSAIDTEVGSTTEFAVRRHDLKRFHRETGLRLDRNGRRP